MEGDVTSCRSTLHIFVCISTVPLVSTYQFEFFAVFLPSFWGDWGESRNQRAEHLLSISPFGRA